MSAIADVVNAMGGAVDEYEDKLIIRGGNRDLRGGVTLSSYNDHRIAMSIAVAATRVKEPIVLDNPQCVKKSYPHFWDDYRALGGNIDG